MKEHSQQQHNSTNQQGRLHRRWTVAQSCRSSFPPRLLTTKLFLPFSTAWGLWGQHDDNDLTFSTMALSKWCLCVSLRCLCKHPVTGTDSLKDTPLNNYDWSWHSVSLASCSKLFMTVDPSVSLEIWTDDHFLKSLSTGRSQKLGHSVKYACWTDGFLKRQRIY